MRLTRLQVKLINAVQPHLHRLNPSAIVEVEKLLTEHNLCFRQVAEAQARQKYERIASELTDAERSVVVRHLALPGADQLLIFEEGSNSRAEFSPAAAEDAAQPAVQKLHGLARRSFRAPQDLSLSQAPCGDQIRADAAARGIRLN
jgi:hypothetical protein